MKRIESGSWSSVRTTTTFGATLPAVARPPASRCGAGSSVAEPPATSTRTSPVATTSPSRFSSGRSFRLCSGRAAVVLIASAAYLALERRREDDDSQEAARQDLNRVAGGCLGTWL